MSGLNAGAAVQEITPSKSVFLVGYPHVDRWSTGSHDPLSVSASAIQNDSTTILTAAVDLLFVNPWTARRWRSAVAEKLNIPQENVFISCSHTHSGPHTCEVLEWGPSPVVPPVDADYLEFVQQQIVNAASQALASARPAEAAWTSTLIDGVGGNRHDPLKGASDKEAGILVLREENSRKIISVSVIYGMHPTVLHEDSTLISSDFPHYTRLELQENLGEAIPVLYHTGPAGDQSTRYDVSGQTFSEAERLGRKMGKTITTAVKTLQDRNFSTEAALESKIAAVTLPRRKIPSVEECRTALDDYRRVFEELKESGAAHGPVRTAECDVYGAEETLYLAQCQANGELERFLSKYDPIDIQVMQIADVFWLVFPENYLLNLDCN